MNAIPCSTCGEEGHRAHRCPSLCAPLQSGFYAPPAGARQGGDDDDESLRVCKIQKKKSKNRAECPLTLILMKSIKI